MTVTTSRVFDAMDRLYVLLAEETTFPAHQQSAETPLVVFGGLVKEETREPIVIVGSPSDAPELDWAVFGKVGIDEVFAVRIEVATMVPSMTGREALVRIGELTSTIEIALREQVTGRPAGGFVQPILFHRVGRILPVLSLGGEGVVASCSIDVMFRARI